MKVKLIKGWNGQGPGAILELTPHDAGRQLIKRGIAVEVEEPKRKPRLQEWVKDAQK